MLGGGVRAEPGDLSLWVHMVLTAPCTRLDEEGASGGEVIFGGGEGQLNKGSQTCPWCVGRWGVEARGQS